MNCRWWSVVLCATLLCPVSMRAEDVERLQGEVLEKVSKALVEASGKLTDLPIKVSLAETKAMGLKAKGAAAVVVPDARLSAEAVEKIDREPLPVGILFLHKITPVAVDEAVAVDQHRTAEVTVDTKTVTVSIVALAVSKVAGRLVLLAYTKGKAPALVTEMSENEEKIELPLDLTARKVGNNRAAILVNVLGKYRAAIPVAGQE